jgi:hypothetical protein
VLIIGVKTLGLKHPAEIIFDPHPSPLDLPSTPATPQPQGILLKTGLIDKLLIVSRHLKDYSSLQSTVKLFNRAILARMKRVRMTSKDADILILHPSLHAYNFISNFSYQLEPLLIFRHCL